MYIIKKKLEKDWPFCKKIAEFAYLAENMQFISRKQTFWYIRAVALKTNHVIWMLSSIV